MFQESLVESSALLRSNNRWPAILSFTIQAIVVAAFLAIPLLHPELLPLPAPRLASLADPISHPLPPPRTPVHIVTTLSSAPSTSTPQAPVASTAPMIRLTGTPTDEPLPGVALNLGPATANPLNNLGVGTNPGPHIVVGNATSTSTSPSSRVTLSTGVTNGLLLDPIRPEYPAIARISRTEGTVVIHAIISTAGRIESAHVLSGPAMLQAAALQAVRNARYRPYLLNNQPTEVETTITINFRLSS